MSQLGDWRMTVAPRAVASLAGQQPQPAHLYGYVMMDVTHPSASMSAVCHTAAILDME